MFSCVICSDRLDRCPGSQPSSEAVPGEINISSAPCGHIFHTFCIQKWFTQGLASSKCCPLCKQAVPKCRTLPLFPDLYVELDDEGGGRGNPNCDHTHFHQQLNTLKSTTEGLRDKVSELEELLVIEKDCSSEYKKKYENEKNRSDTYFMQWKQAESFQSLAEQLEKQCKEASAKLKHYELIGAIVNNVKDAVETDLSSYPCTTKGLESLLEVHHVVNREYQKTTKKVRELDAMQEARRQEAAKWKGRYEKLRTQYLELRSVYKNESGKHVTETDKSEIESPFAEEAGSKVVKSAQLRLQGFDATTPLSVKPAASRKRNNPIEMTASSSSQEEDVDNSVPLLAPITFGKKKKIQFSKGASTSTSLNSKETIKGSKRKNVGDSGCVVASGSSGASSGSSQSSMSSKAAVPSGSYKFSFSKKTAATKPNDNLNKTILIPDSDSDVDEEPIRHNLPGVKIRRLNNK